jgi:hypothetical protein
VITVYADGKVDLYDRRGNRTTKADPGAIQALQTLLASPEFAALEVPVVPPGSDQFVYKLTVPGRSKPIVTTDSADNPPLLKDIMSAIEQMKREAK